MGTTETNNQTGIEKMTTLFDIYEGAIDNANNNDAEVNTDYFVEYAFNAMDIALDEDQIKMIDHFHAADQNSYDEVVAMKDIEIN